MINTRVKEIIGNIANFILNILLIIITIIVFIGIYYILQITAFQKEYGDIFGYTFFEVATGSMADTINIGDVVIVKITKDVDVNDIIVYKSENNFITHRIIKKEGDKYITKGDANNSQDKPIEEEQILGKVDKVIYKMGILKKVLSSPEIIALTLTVIVLIGILIAYTKSGGKENDK